jgi:uncharacterized delta-60 repeat protein
MRRLLALAMLFACGGEASPAPAPPIADPPPNSTHLALTIQSAPRFILAGSPIDIVVAVARDGNDAYDGEVEIALAPADGFTALPIAFTQLETSRHLSLSVSAARTHGVAPLRLVATSKDKKASGELALPIIVRGPPGALDTSFGDGGIFVLGEPSAEATSITTQPDGKVVLGGRIGGDGAIVRLTPDGQLDASFATGGKARVAIPGLVSTHDVVLEPGGAIVLGGTGPAQTVLARFSSLGVLDASFGVGGVLAVAGQASSRALAVAEGNLYLGGQSAAPADAGALQVLRLQPSGALEPNWGAKGEAVLPPGPGPCALGPSGCVLSAISPKGDGRLTMCASRGDGVNLRELFASGVEDRNYDLTTTADVLSRCTAIANNTPLDFWAAGTRNTDVFAIAHFVVAVAGGPLTVDTRIPPFSLPAETGVRGATRLVAGAGVLIASADATPGGGPSQLAVVRVVAFPQALDTSFGNGKGYVTTPVGTTPAFSRALGFQSEGRVIVAGTNGDMVAVRYWL